MSEIVFTTALALGSDIEVSNLVNITLKYAEDDLNAVNIKARFVGSDIGLELSSKDISKIVTANSSLFTELGLDPECFKLELKPDLSFNIRTYGSN